MYLIKLSMSGIPAGLLSMETVEIDLRRNPLSKVFDEILPSGSIEVGCVCIVILLTDIACIFDVCCHA